jgi:hypothetical protein
VCGNGHTRRDAVLTSVTGLIRCAVAMACIAVAVPGVAQESPTADGGWSVQVVTSGGIRGRGRGEFVVTSTGALTCTRASDQCSRMLSEDEARRVAALIAAATAGAEWVRQPESTCSDCFKTTMTLRRREGEIVRSLVAQWDDSQAAAPPLRRLADAIVALGGSAARQ